MGHINMDGYAITLAVFGLLLAGIVKGATGLGYASCALPFLVMTVGLKAAMGLILAPALATNVSLAFATGHFRETLASFRWLYLSMLPGIALGSWMLGEINPKTAVRILGFVIVGYVILALAKPGLRMPLRLRQPLQWPTGFLNGVVTGLTGAQVMPLFPYFMALQIDPDRTVQAINLAVTISTTVLAFGLMSTGGLTPMLFAGSVCAIVPALVGVELGVRARQRIPAQHFRQLALLTLLVIGILLLAR